MDLLSRNNVTITGRADGPVVMPAPGFGCDQHVWRLPVPLLAGRYRRGPGGGRCDPARRGRGPGRFGRAGSEVRFRHAQELLRAYDRPGG